MTTAAPCLPLGAPLRIAVSAGAVVLVGVATAFGPLPGALAVAAVVAGLALMSRPDVAAVLAVGLVPATSGLARGLPLPGLRLSELLTVACAAAVLLPNRPRSPGWRAVDWLALLYVVLTAGLGAAGALRHDVPFDGTSIGTLLGPLQFLLLYRTVVVGLTTDASRTWALRALLVPAVPIAVLAVLQRFGPHTIGTLMNRLSGSAAYDENLLYFTPRVTGPFPHWHVLGGYLLVVALVALAVLTARCQRVVHPLLICAGLAVVLPALLLTLTAAVVGGLAVGGALVLLSGHRPGRSLFGMSVVGTVGLVAAWPLIAARVADQAAGAGSGGSFVPETITTRLEIWSEQYFPVLQDRLLLGYGPTIPPEVVWDYTESLYISLLLRGGVPLVLAQAALAAAAYLACRRAYRLPEADPHGAAAARAVAAVTLVLVPMHAVFPYFVTTGLPHAWWAALAIATTATGKPFPSAARPAVQRQRIAPVLPSARH